MDMSKAFDDVNHQILIHKLYNCFGISGSLLGWFSPSLLNRRQRVTVLRATSSEKPVMSGVPQGSILGPILFLLCSELTESEVANVLKSLDPNKACGPGGIPNRLLQNVSTEIAPSLCKLFNLSLSQGVVPSEWKLANLSPILKTDDPTLSSNYRPISLLNTISKVLERCVFNHCSKHLEPQIYHLQHGFMKG